VNTASEPPSTAEHGLAAFLQRLQWEEIDQGYLSDLALRSKQEDLEGFGLRSPPSRLGDRTSEALGLTGEGEATLVARESLVVCGQGMIPYLLEQFGGKAVCDIHHLDGDWVERGSILGKIRGSRVTLLAAERSVLNFIQRLSGIATITKKFVGALAGGETILLDTRKTTPGLRALEKYAVATGGGWNHRYGLFDRIMIKDNHLAACGALEGQSLTETAQKAKAVAPDLLVQVEVDRLEQIKPALKAKADALLLDNFSLNDLRKALVVIGTAAITEASGGITLESIPCYADLGLDFLSTSALVGHAAWRDVGLDWLS
jgi:nicotinate-nucleotide pyrophosphorylase (carboxylating)